LAEFDGKPEAACLIAYSQQYPVAYYHFAGSYNAQPSLGISHLMVLAACEYVKAMGLRYLYLGGGRTNEDDDKLLLFKSGFSQERLPVFTYEVKYT
jgi:lipid II:glycine glycyltransferase (peptidoglycan interpeptide bridge formation enzyme)